MRNAPATFQRLINTVISGMEHCNAYLDDIVVHLSTWNEHIATLKELFSRLDAANLTVNLAKTDFVKAMVSFNWTVATQGAFENCKMLLSTAPVLQAPDLTRPFKLEIDASVVGMGAVPLQEDDASLDHPVSYFSKKFAKYQ
uniref:ribonuclease H n=1 Tax=Nothobranchius pienaari TaxID=704102 RepID=A0A1A8KZA0_9TELE